MSVKKVGIVGFGGMGKRHGKDLEEFSDRQIQIISVVEPSDESFKAGCEWLGKVPARFASLEIMLNQLGEELDGIVISSPNFTHLECLLKLTGRTIPLILEKPLDSDLKKVRQIVNFAENYQAPIMVHHVMRYSPIVLKAKEIIGSGQIGEIAGFQLCQFMHGHMFHNFRRTFKTGGGQLLEKATHDFDVLLFLTDSLPERVASLCKRQYFGGNRANDLHCIDCAEKAECKHLKVVHNDFEARDLCVFAGEIDIFDNESCLIELKNGAIGSYSECFFSRAPFSRRYEFNGSEGFMSVDFSQGTILLKNNRNDKTYDFNYHNRIHYNGSTGVVRHFLELMDGKTQKVHSPVSEAFAAELISFAAYESCATGAFINIDEFKQRHK